MGQGFPAPTCLLQSLITESIMYFQAEGGTSSPVRPTTCSSQLLSLTEFFFLFFVFQPNLVVVTRYYRRSLPGKTEEKRDPGCDRERTRPLPKTNYSTHVPPRKKRLVFFSEKSTSALHRDEVGVFVSLFFFRFLPLFFSCLPFFHVLTGRLVFCGG